MTFINIFPIVYLFILAALFSWPFLSLISLYALRIRALNETERVLWAILITAVPVLGALAFYIINPGQSEHE